MFTRTGRPKDRPRASHSRADFARKFKMITEEEYQACLKGDMGLERNGCIFNANASKDVTPVPTGVFQRLYMGRAEDIMIAQMLGVEWKGK